MKKTLKLSNKRIIIIAMLSCLLSFANGSPIKIKKETNKVSVTLYDLEQGDILSIVNEEGAKVYKEKIVKKGSYTKGFNLTTLDNGYYIFELDKGLMISSIPFSVNMNIVTFYEENETTIYKPHFRVNRKTVYLTRLTFDPEPLMIDIYFKTNNTFKLIHSENIENIKGIEKAYKLKGLKCGAYKIVARDNNGREFSKVIEQLK